MFTAIALVFSVTVFALLSQDDKGPLTIEAEHMSMNCGWRLTVESNGDAEIRVRRRLRLSVNDVEGSEEDELSAVKESIENRHTRRSFRVASKQLEAVRTTLFRERFFELNDHYGEYLLDNTWRTVIVSFGERSKTVTFQGITEDTKRTVPRKNWLEMERVLKIWLAVSDLFEDERDDDLRAHYRSLLMN